MKKHSDSNLEKFENVQEKDIPQIINAIESQPFLAEKRMIIIKDVPQSADTKKKLETEALESVIEDIPESSLVIFVSPKPDKRVRFYKQLAKIATLELFELPKGRDLQIWVQQRLKAQGKTMSPSALNLLLLYCAEDLDRIAGELEKLQLLDLEMIGEEEIKRFVSASPEAKIFQALDLIGKAPRQEVLKSFEQLVRSGEELMLIFFMIVRQFRLLLQTRYLMDRQSSKPAIQKRLKIAPFQVSMLCKQASSFSYDTLKRGYHQLSVLDFQIKTGKIPVTAASAELLHLKIDQFLCSIVE